MRGDNFLNGILPSAIHLLMVRILTCCSLARSAIVADRRDGGAGEKKRSALVTDLRFRWGAGEKGRLLVLGRGIRAHWVWCFSLRWCMALPVRRREPGN